MSSKRVVIVGYDAVSPLGTEMDTQWARAIRGESGIGALTRFPLTDDFPVNIAGQKLPKRAKAALGDAPTDDTCSSCSASTNVQPKRIRPKIATS